MHNLSGTFPLYNHFLSYSIPQLKPATQWNFQILEKSVWLFLGYMFTRIKILVSERFLGNWDQPYIQQKLLNKAICIHTAALSFLSLIFRENIHGKRVHLVMQKSIWCKQLMKHTQFKLQAICEKHKGYRRVAYSCSTVQPLALFDKDFVYHH